MRVLHVITGLAAGGAEHQLRLLLRHLPYECEVATLTNAGQVAELIRADGTPVHDLRMRHNRDLGVVGRLVRLIRAGRFDVVHTHLYRACVYGRIAARLAGVARVVATEHSIGDGVVEGRTASAGVRALYRATERLGDTTIAVSNRVAGHLAAWGVAVHRIQVVTNGIDPREYAYDPALRRDARRRLGIAAQARVVGAVGRLAPSKRFDLLIRALPGLDDATLLLLVGDGSDRAALADLARQLGVADRVVFAGSAPQVRDMLAAMDVFAAPSDQETFGLAVLEALAAGLPALYVTSPALDELPAGPAPGARRLPLDAGVFQEGLRAEFTALARRGGARLPVPAAVAHYDIAAAAAAVSNVYERPTRQRWRIPAPRYRAVRSEGS